MRQDDTTDVSDDPCSCEHDRIGRLIKLREDAAERVKRRYANIKPKGKTKFYDHNDAWQDSLRDKQPPRVL